MTCSPLKRIRSWVIGVLLTIHYPFGVTIPSLIIFPLLPAYEHTFFVCLSVLDVGAGSTGRRVSSSDAKAKKSAARAAPAAARVAQK